MSVLGKLHGLLLKTESLILVTLLLSMILIAVVQILLRNFFGGGLLWADAYTRTCVLWVALLGAMIAGRQQDHIAIEVLLQYLPSHKKGLAKRISYFLTGLVCFAAAWFSTGFVLQEYHYGGKAFAEIPSWWCEAIIPFAFAVIALRYSIAAFMPHKHPL
ncbi:MAG: C4-dicarboxylate ABC transporter permease [Methylomonas sp.]|nr:MAG: C4-dicarboxylate ABC transporter permease [Methylomonas sp.]